MKLNYHFVVQKITLAILAGFLSASCFSQDGIYKTVDEYKSSKPSVTGDGINVTFLFGKWTIAVLNGKDKQKFSTKDIWGYRRKNTDYRIIKGQPHAITTKGVFYVYSGSADYIETFGDSVAYHKQGAAYPLVSKGFDATPQVVHSSKDLLKMMEPVKAAAIKQMIGKKVTDPSQRGVGMIIIQHVGPSSGVVVVKVGVASKRKVVQLTQFIEDVADYYNSVKPDYLAKRYSTIVYNPDYR